MVKDLIIIENGEEYNFDTLEELVKELIDENYYNMTESEKQEKMEMKALANCINHQDIEVVKEYNIEDLNKKFVIADEITYILSLLQTNNLILLERNGADIFTKDLDKEGLKSYIIVNTFAKELLKSYLKE